MTHGDYALQKFKNYSARIPMACANGQRVQRSNKLERLLVSWELSTFTKTGHNNKVVRGLFKNSQIGGESIFVYCIEEIALSQ